MTSQILDRLGAAQSVDVLHLFRDMLVDITCATAFNYQIGALQGRSQGRGVNYLVQAIDDFVKRGIVVGESRVTPLAV